MCGISGAYDMRGMLAEPVGSDSILPEYPQPKISQNQENQRPIQKVRG